MEPPPPPAAALIGRSRPELKTEKPAGDGDSPASKQHLLGLKVGNYHGKQEHETEEKTSSSSDQKDLTCTKLQEDELECARAEMGEVREENERLKMSLSRMMKDYEALRMQFMGIVRRDDGKKLTAGGDDMSKNVEKQTEETELVSLTLGRSFPAPEDKDHNKDMVNKHEQGVKETLSLGLSCKFEELEQESKAKLELNGNNSLNPSPTNSSDRDPAKEDVGETTWPPPSKGLKTARGGDDNDATQHNPPKRARVCVRARCDTATMNDGCQWRKYGQKIAKGNPCPRAYYRCTGSPTCPVRKQVQRCADDMSILITTYEGNHNHPLPVSATAMASTTSAAASMLLSGSSSTSTHLHGLNFHTSNSKHFYLPNSSSISSTSPTHPTITLDLTSNPSSSANNNPQSHFGKFAPSFASSRYPFTSQLDFGSSRNNVLSWSNGLLSYANQGGYSTNRINNNSTAAHNNIFHNYIQRSNSVGSLPAPAHQPDTIAAATKAITADPSFQSALAAALTSIIGNGGGGLVKSSSAARSGDHQYQPAFQLSSSAAKGNGCGTSFLSNIAAAGTAAGAPSSSPPAGNLVFVPTSSSLPFSNPKSASASPGDHIDLTN